MRKHYLFVSPDNSPKSTEGQLMSCPRHHAYMVCWDRSNHVVSLIPTGFICPTTSDCLENIGDEFLSKGNTTAMTCFKSRQWQAQIKQKQRH